MHEKEAGDEHGWKQGKQQRHLQRRERVPGAGNNENTNRRQVGVLAVLEAVD